MKRLLSSFLTIIMVLGIVSGLPMTASAAGIETLKPDEELRLTWSADEMYAYVEVAETGYYDISAIKGNASYGRYYCYIESDRMSYTIGKPSEDWDIVSFPYTYSNVYLEAGVEYLLTIYCYDAETWNNHPGDITFLMTKNDYTETKVGSSTKTVVADENEIQWFTVESAAAGEYWFNFGSECRAYVLDYNTLEIVSWCTAYYDTASFNLEANKKYKIAAFYYSANPQPMRVSFGKYEKEIVDIDIVDSSYLAHQYVNEDDLYYCVKFSDNSKDYFSYYFFRERGVSFYVSYLGSYSDEYDNYMSIGKQPVGIYYNDRVFESEIEVISYVEFVSDLGNVEAYDDLRIEYENTETQRYFWRVKLDETNKYSLYSTQWDEDLWDWYNYEIFDENNNLVPYTGGGWNLKGGEEYALMFAYRYNEYSYDDFYYSIDPMDDHGDHTHTKGSWVVEKKATVNSAGKKVRKCTDCGKVLESAKIAQLKCSKPSVSKIENTSSGVKLTWGKVSGADKYYIYRKTGSSGKYSKIGSSSSTSYTDKSAKSGKKYYYYVKAINEAGASSASGTKSITHLADTTLKTPSSTKSGIKLSWGKITGAEGYQVYRKTGSGSYSKIATVKGNSKVSYTDKSAKKNKTYTYKIRAYKGSTYSAYSNTKKIKDKY